ncbi:MAG: EamA family transporter [Clostridia bacterium]
MWYLYSLIALLCWSGSDLFSKVGSRPDDKYSHFKMIMAVGFVMGLHAIYQLVFGGVTITFGDILKYLPVSALYIGSMLLGYIGLRYIELSISSPVCNSSGALAALLCFIFLHQEINTLQIIAICLTVAGVVGLGIVEYREDEQMRILRQEKANVKYTKSVIAILLPLLYCLLDALGTFADAVVLETMDENVANVAYELTFLTVGFIAFVVIVLFKKQRFTLKADLPKLFGGILETGGQFAYIFAIGANAIVSAPIISSYCVLSVIWSRIFLKEKLSYKHYIAIFLTICGIVMLGFE